VPGAALGVMFGFWAIARLAGFWETSIPAEAFRLAYQALGL
jgi:hypothetical protein